MVTFKYVFLVSDKVSAKSKVLVVLKIFAKI